MRSAEGTSACFVSDMSCVRPLNNQCSIGVNRFGDVTGRLFFRLTRVSDKGSRLFALQLWLLSVSSSFVRYQGQLYSSPEVPLDELEEFMFQKLLQNGAFFRNVLRPDKFIRNTMRTMQKKLMGQPTSFTDIFGESLKDALLSNVSDAQKPFQVALVTC